MNRSAPGWRMWVAPTTMMLCTLLGYIDRQVLAALSPTILTDTGMTAGDYGWAVSAFSITYMIMNPVFGSFLDHIGLRRGMAIAVLIWTVASVSHGLGMDGSVPTAGSRLAWIRRRRGVSGALSAPLPKPFPPVNGAIARHGSRLQRRVAGRADHAAPDHPHRRALRLEICVCTDRLSGSPVADSVVARSPAALSARTELRRKGPQAL